MEIRTFKLNFGNLKFKTTIKYFNYYLKCLILMEAFINFHYYIKYFN
jgi:hypothetical protein